MTIHIGGGCCYSDFERSMPLQRSGGSSDEASS